MGGERPRASTSGRAAAHPLQGTSTLPSPPRPPLRHSCAGRNHPLSPHTHPPHTRTYTTPFPNSSLPPLRGEVRWGVGAPSLRQRSSGRPMSTRSPRPTSPPSPLRPSPSFLRRQEPPLSPHTHPPHTRTHTTPFPNSSLPPFRGEVRWGVGGPERPPAAERQPAPSKAHPHPRPPQLSRRRPTGVK